MAKTDKVWSGFLQYSATGRRGADTMMLSVMARTKKIMEGLLRTNLAVLETANMKVLQVDIPSDRAQHMTLSALYEARPGAAKEIEASGYVVLDGSLHAKKPPAIVSGGVLKIREG